MNAKRNLTVAALAALLAVPALNGTNISHALHMPSVTAHAAYQSQNGVMLTQSDLEKVNPRTTGYGPGAGGHQAGLPWNSPNAGEQSSVGYYNGHSFYLPDNGGPIVYQLDGQSNPSLSAVNAALGDNNGGNNDAADSSTNTNTSTQSQQYNSSNTQYTSQSGQLPQTNENNGASKAAALGVAAATASIGLAALSFAKKHRNMEVADLANTVSASNDKSKGNDTPKYSNKSSYNMIMSDTFADLGKSLKNL